MTGDSELVIVLLFSVSVILLQIIANCVVSTKYKFLCSEITQEIRCCRLLPVNKQSPVTFYYGDIVLYYLITPTMLDTRDGGLELCCFIQIWIRTILFSDSYFWTILCKIKILMYLLVLYTDVDTEDSLLFFILQNDYVKVP